MICSRDWSCLGEWPMCAHASTETVSGRQTMRAEPFRMGAGSGRLPTPRAPVMRGSVAVVDDEPVNGIGAVREPCHVPIDARQLAIEWPHERRKTGLEPANSAPSPCTNFRSQGDSI